MTLIFLDFDGVLHPYARWPFTDEARRSHFQHLPRLERVLRDFPQVYIVIASDWRLHNSIDELRSHFSVDIQPRVIGMTAEDRARDGERGGRHVLAERYLAENNLIGARWIAIDDTERNYLPSSPLVLCAGQFSTDEEAQLRQRLEALGRDDVCAMVSE